MALEVSNLGIKIEGKEIIAGLNLKVEKGEVVALMGPNGSGKSTLAFSLMGHPGYEVVDGRIDLDGEDVVSMTPDERSRRGLFLAVQYPVSIPGVSVREVLLASLRARGEIVSALDLRKRIEAEGKALMIDEELLKRGLNEGFSGGEKKKMEILQMRVLEPRYAVMDETDSGLDIDALKIVAKGAAYLAKKKGTGILVITHYQRLLKYLKPQRVLVMSRGKIVREGDFGLVEQLEKTGYKQYE